MTLYRGDTISRVDCSQQLKFISSEFKLLLVFFYLIATAAWNFVGFGSPDSKHPNASIIFEKSVGKCLETNVYAKTKTRIVLSIT